LPPATYTEQIKQKNSFYAISCAIALLTILGLAMRSSFRSHSMPTQRLPDGSWLSVVSVSYGTNHSYELPSLKPWQIFTVHHLPQSWAARLGWWEGSGTVSANAEADEPPFLVIFTLGKMSASTSFSSDPQMALCDEKGNIFDSTAGGPTVSDQDSRLVGWIILKPLPSSKRLILRFSELAADRKTRTQVAEFNVPNPIASVPEKTGKTSN
jgi:hypothetical protein